jgi:hypothetical protein
MNIVSVMASEIIDVPDARDGFDAIKGAQDEERSQAISENKQLFSKKAREGQNDAQVSISRMDSGTNDPNVKFEAGVGVEGYIGFGAEGGKMGTSLSARQVYYVSDGDDESFDLDVHDKTIIKAGFSVGKFQGEGTYMPLQSGHSIEVSVELPLAGAENLDASTLINNLSQAFQAINATSAIGCINAAGSALNNLGGEMSQMASNGSAQAKIVIGGKLEYDNSWNRVNGEISFGIGVDLGFGSSMAKISYEKGNKVTKKF